MIVSALRGLLMAGEAPTPEEMVPSFLHALMWACIFGAVEAVMTGRPWPVWTGALALSLTSHIVGIKWRQIKPTVGPQFAAIVERIASNRRYRRVIYLLIIIALMANIGFGIYRHYHPMTPATDSKPVTPPPPSKEPATSPTALPLTGFLQIADVFFSSGNSTLAVGNDLELNASWVDAGSEPLHDAVGYVYLILVESPGKDADDKAASLYEQAVMQVRNDYFNGRLKGAEVGKGGGIWGRSL